MCDDCERKLSTLAAPDPFKAGGGGHEKAGPARVGENKALRKGIRSNPYGNCCKICKMKVQQNSATYCTQCAYGKGICAICGKQVLDTSMYKMSEGLSLHKVNQNRDEASFKSAEQIAREGAQQNLLAYLTETGQVGRMPTRVALERAGKSELAEALISSYGGLHAAADAMGLSKRLLNEEAEARKQAKREAAQQAAEELRAAAEARQLQELEQQQHEGGGEAVAAAEGGDGDGEEGDDADSEATDAADAPPDVDPWAALRGDTSSDEDSSS